jgi:hypothetical protein
LQEEPSEEQTISPSAKWAIKIGRRSVAEVGTNAGLVYFLEETLHFSHTLAEV